MFSSSILRKTSLRWRPRGPTSSSSMNSFSGCSNPQTFRYEEILLFLPCRYVAKCSPNC